MGAIPARAELEVTAQKRFDLQSMSVRGDFGHFLKENPTYLTGNEFRQNLRVEATGDLARNVHLDLMLDDSLIGDEERRIRLDVSGRVWNLTLGRFPVYLEGNRFLMAPRTGMGAQVTADFGRQFVEGFVMRPEGQTHRNFFQGKGALQEYALTSKSGAQNPLIVVGSERVNLDGRRLERGRDYRMDYLEGALILSNELLPLDERSRITVEFEESASGSGFSSTVKGGRVTHFFDREAGALVSLGMVTSKDKADAEAYEQDPDLKARELGVYELSGRVPLSNGVLFEFRGGLSQRDLDRQASGDEIEAKAYEFALGYDRGPLKLGLARSRVGTGFQGLGLDRFQTAGDRRFASQNGQLEVFRWAYQLRPTVSVRGLFRQALTNLEDNPALVREEVDSSNFEVDFDHVLGGDLDLRFAAEEAETRAANAATAQASERKTLALLYRRRLGILGLSGKADWEENQNAQSNGEDSRSLGVELTSPNDASVAWSLGGGVREVGRQDLVDPLRKVRDVHASASATPRPDLRIGLDLKHRREENGPGSSEDLAPLVETNTGGAKLSYRRGDRLEIESSFRGEVKSRIYLDELSVADDAARNGQNPTDTLLPQTQVVDEPLLSRQTKHRLTYRPHPRWEIGMGMSLRTEDDLSTQERKTLDRTRDARMAYHPRSDLTVQAEGLRGWNVQPASQTDRSVANDRIELTRTLENGSNLRLSRTYEKIQDSRQNIVDETREDYRMGYERNFGRALRARTGLTLGRENRGTPQQKTGVDAGLDYSGLSPGTRLGVGVKLDTLRSRAKATPEETRRSTYSLTAGSKIGSDGFLDMAVNWTSSGDDGQGLGGYRAVTSNVSVGLEF